MDKISIIVPVYNSEPYLRKCLDSIVSQTYKNLEILCVDDGSYDKSAEICDEYAKNDSRFKVFHKQIKGGTGTPVNSLNIGLMNFTGRYVGFVDPDDWVEPDMYEILYNTLNGKDVSISAVNFFRDTDDDSIKETNEIAIPGNALSPHDMLLYTFHRERYRSFFFAAWNKLYSAELFIKNKELRFDAEYKYAYDVLFNVQAFLTEDCTGAYTDKPLYHFYQRETSITHSPSAEMMADDLRVFELIVDILVSKGYADISVWVKRIHAYHAGLYAEQALKSGDERLFAQFQAKMRRFSDIYIEKNRNYPDRVKWFKKLLEEEIQ